MNPSRLSISLVFSFAWFLSACGSTAAPVATQSLQPTPALTPNASPGVVELRLSEKVDSQGAVMVIVRPLPWSSQSETLDFEIAMDTHSVDLSFDLASLATLTTDTGLTAQAVRWEAPGGGHHVRGKLSFSAVVGGKPLLSGLSKLTLTLKDVAAPQRTFIWELYQ